MGFDCTARDWLCETETRYAERTVASNIEEHCAVTSNFRLSAKHLPATPSECLDKWLELLETGDLGVPMPPPVVLDEGAADGTRVGYERLILPPGLRERVLEVERGEARARVSYTVVNPSWLMCYPAIRTAATLSSPPPMATTTTTIMERGRAVGRARCGGPLSGHSAVANSSYGN